MRGNKERRLLLLGPVAPPVGGVATVFQTLLRGGLDKYFKIALLNTIVSGENAASKERFSLLRIFKALYIGAKLIWLLLFFRPHIVYLSITSPKWSSKRDRIYISIAHFFEAKIALRSSNSLFPAEYKKASKKVRRSIDRMASLAETLHVPGESCKKIFSEIFDPGKIEIIPNGIIHDSFGSIAENRSFNGSRYNILYFGQLLLVKGIVDLIDAFDLIADRNPAYHLRIVGPWVQRSDREVIEWRVAESPFHDRISLEGPVDFSDKAKPLAWADVLVLPTMHGEGQTNVLTEGIAAGLPLIACNKGSMSNVLKDGEGGFFVPENDPKAIARRLEQLLGDSELRRTFSTFNRRLFTSEFTAERYVARVAKDLIRLFD